MASLKYSRIRKLHLDCVILKCYILIVIQRQSQLMLRRNMKICHQSLWHLTGVPRCLTNVKAIQYLNLGAWIFCEKPFYVLVNPCRDTWAYNLVAGPSALGNGILYHINGHFSAWCFTTRRINSEYVIGRWLNRHNGIPFYPWTTHEF